MNQLTFREEDHTYWDGGLRVPNVTSAINLFANSYAGIPKAILEQAMHRGNAVHLATEYYDKGILDYNALDPSLKPYIDAWLRFRQETRFTPTLIEERVYHHGYKYAGTLDRIGIFRDPGNEEVVLDIKTGSAMRPTIGPQTAAYELAHRCETGGKRMDRYGCELHKDGTYKLDKLDDPGDMAVFLASLTLLRWKEKYQK